MTPYRFALIALAVYRLAHMVALEDGPKDVFMKLRTAVKDRYPTVDGKDSWQFKGISCPCCLSVYFSVFVLAVYAFGGGWGERLIIGLAASAVTTAITDATDNE